MITIRRANERGQTQWGWLDSRHSFSFGEYYDPENLGFRSLRVLNEDWVQPGRGFGTHPHRDMEIITYVLEGALEHSDSMGNGSIMRPGEVQRMTAGTGITHSEYNPSKSEPVHLLQIWLLPERRSLTPSYEQRNFQPAQKQGRLVLAASRDGRQGSVTVHQDTDLFVTRLNAGQQVEHRLQPGRHAWVQVASGTVGVNDEKLFAGDGAAASSEVDLRLKAESTSEVLLFDLA